MSNVYESIIAGLAEAVEDAKSTDKKLNRRVVTVMPVKEYRAADVQKIRKATGLSQKLFASYMGVSDKTVEAWEAGTNRPSGAASRILTMMEMNHNLTTEFPFVQVAKE
ncbi:MAG: helix-turn-helix domain-containing protein [Lachnospiraceae bacterium]